MPSICVRGWRINPSDDLPYAISFHIPSFVIEVRHGFECLAVLHIGKKAEHDRVRGILSLFDEQDCGNQMPPVVPRMLKRSEPFPRQSSERVTGKLGLRSSNFACDED